VPQGVVLSGTLLLGTPSVQPCSNCLTPLFDLMPRCQVYLFESLAMSTFAIWSRVVQSHSHDVHPCYLVPRCQVSRCPFSRFQRPPTNFKFCTHIRHIHRIDRNKSPLKILGKVAVGVLRYSRNFSGHPYIGRIARSSLRQLSFLVCPARRCNIFPV